MPESGIAVTAFFAVKVYVQDTCVPPGAAVKVHSPRALVANAWMIGLPNSHTR